MLTPRMYISASAPAFATGALYTMRSCCNSVCKICATVCRYFEERKSEAEEACIIEDSEEREWGSAQCTNLERLEDFVRQFVGQAPTHMFVKTLLVLEAADKRATAKQASSAGLSPRS